MNVAHNVIFALVLFHSLNGLLNFWINYLAKKFNYSYSFYIILLVSFAIICYVCYLIFKEIDKKQKKKFLKNKHR